MKKHSILIILVLAISLSIPLLVTQTQPVYAQPMSHTYTFSKTIPEAEVNFTVTTDIGILVEGNVAVWILRINANSNSSVQNIIVNSVSNGTKISRGLMFPLSNAFASDTNMIPLSPFPFLDNFTLVKSENVLLLEGIAGFPSQTSFNLSVTIKTSENYTVYLASDVPTVSLVLPNPGSAPPVINYYLILLYSMVFLLPISMILSNRWLKIRKLKKEGLEEV
ncbi:MAG: hypothetical protein ACUVXA_06085 [Candidatus Jordarchaeum sp.]|uniref:hypothetical protein n=1 Tax=Candidatus Jordarchaeum sp. TaxID=2823881 RepID=UPI004049900D